MRETGAARISEGRQELVFSEWRWSVNAGPEVLAKLKIGAKVKGLDAGFVFKFRFGFAFLP